MRLYQYEGPMRMHALAKDIIRQRDIRATCSIKKIHLDHYTPTLTFTTRKIIKRLLFGENIFLLNLILIGKEIPDGHSIRDLFFLIHNLVTVHEPKKQIECDSQYIASTATLGCDGIGLFNLYGSRISIVHAGGLKIGRGVEIGEGTCIARGVLDDTIIDPFVRIGYNCNIGHGSHIGSGTTIVDGANIGGSVEIGKDCWIGLGATIREGVKICDRVVVGMGSVVTKDIETCDHKYYGVPAKKEGVWDGTW